MSRYSLRGENTSGRGRSSRYNDDENERGSRRNSGRNNGRNSRYNDDEDRGRSSRGERGERYVPKELSAIKKSLSAIDSDMKGALQTILSNHRKKVDKKEVLQMIKNVNTDGCLLQVNYDEKIQMCPSFSIMAGGRSGRRSGSSYGGDLEYNGKSVEKDKSIYDKTTLENKFDSIMDVFVDIKKLLEFEIENEKDIKVSSRNSTLSIIDGTLVLTPSMLLLNSLKDDIKKLSI